MKDNPAMPHDGDGDAPRPASAAGDNAADADDAGREEETARMLGTGSRAGDRSGGLAFLALMVVLGGALHFYFGGGGYAPGDLDADLRRHAELSLAAHRENPNLVIVPSWPVRLYRILRRDSLVYLAFAGLAAYLWGLAVRSRSRRDAYLVHEKQRRELAEIKARLDRLENPPPGNEDKNPSR